MTARLALVALLLAACGGSDGGEAGPDTTPQTFGADDPGILYTGRIDFSDPTAPSYSAPGVYLRARFEGVGAKILLEDQFLYGGRNYYDVVIDSEPPVKLTPEPGVTEYTVASDLPYGEHELTLVKRTEASIGATTFHGLEIEGTLLSPPERSERTIEVVGDSITCGSGVEGETDAECAEDGWGQPYNNADLSYGHVMAGILDAELHITAVSGIGLVRNYSDQYDARPMPEVYDLLYLERMGSPAYDTSLFVPDVLVVALGTNDFSPGDNPPDDPRPNMDPETYLEAYIAFVERLRDTYPETEIFCISSPMLGNGWPDPADQFATDLKDTVTAVEQHFADADDSRVHAFLVTKLSGRGCGTHPNVEQQAYTAEELSGAIRAVAGW